MKRNYKRLMATIAGAVIMSAAALPGIPAATVHAADNPNTSIPPAATLQVNPAQAEKPNAINLSGEEAPTSYQKALNATATAYAPGPKDNAQWGNKTHLGTQIRPGVIAVDPKVIPLGSQVYIQYPDGHGEYAVAEDTGGAIKGNRIDIAMQSRKQAQNFGIRHVKLYVVSTPQKA
jgi:3D (Asp-Asp-Asp) domain-containing protein